MKNRTLMNKFGFILVTQAVLFVATGVLADDGMEQTIVQKLKNDAISEVQVEITDNEVVAKIRPTVFSAILSPWVQQQFVNMYKIQPFSKLTIQLYDGASPAVAYSVAGDVLADGTAAALGNGAFLEKIDVKDVRPVGQIIISELAAFKLKVLNVGLNENEALISLNYQNTKEQFAQDFPPMNLLVVEYAPWINTIKWQLVNNGKVEGETQVHVQDVLDLYKDNLSVEDFYKKVFAVDDATKPTETKGVAEADSEPNMEPANNTLWIALGIAGAIGILLIIILATRRKKE